MNQAAGVLPRNKAPAEGAEAPRDILGATGEAACAVHLGLVEHLFKLDRPERDSCDLPPNIDVKSRPWVESHCDLLVQCDDAPWKDYWLVYVGERGLCDVVGHAPWARVVEFGVIRELRPERPCYVVPVGALLPPTMEGVMATEIVVRGPMGEPRALEVASQPDALRMGPAELQLVRELMCPKATDAELALFGKLCLQTGLNPFNGQIWLVPRWDSRVGREVARPMVGIDGLRLTAQRSGKYRGQIGPWWCGEDGAWRDVWLGSQPPAAARIGVLHADFDEPLFAVARFEAYAVRNPKSNELQGLWPKMPAEQLAKCCEALALRRAFPGETQGLHTAEEMEAAMAIAGPVVDPGTPQGLPDRGGTVRAGQNVGGPQVEPVATPEGGWEPEEAKLKLASAAARHQGQRPSRPASDKQVAFVDKLLAACWPDDPEASDRGAIVLEFLFGERLNMDEATTLIEWLKSGDGAQSTVRNIEQFILGAPPEGDDDDVVEE